MLHTELMIESLVIVSILTILSIRLKVLDMYGGITAAIIGMIVYQTVGRLGILSLCIFLLVSGLATRVGYEYKKSIGVIESKSGIRGFRNVIGNGLVAAIISIIYSINYEHSGIFLAGFLGSVSAVFADTLATEIGLLYKGKPRLIIGLKKTMPGTPGGVTTYGYAGALSSSLILIIALTPFLINNNLLGMKKAALIILLSGIGGTTIDSIAGQLLQATYKCIICGITTEYPFHCGEKCEKIKGNSYVNNHLVNIICSAAGVAIGMIGYEIF